MIRNPFSRLPRQYFKAIVADPGTRFEVWDEETGAARTPQARYTTMSLDAIAALPVGTLAARDSHLFFWTTTALAAVGAHIPIMRAWGFKPSALAFCWVKTGPHARLRCLSVDTSFPMGWGFTTRKNVELCFLGRRGSPQRLSKSVRELLISPRREHSRKPDEFYHRVEEYCAGPYLELFSRQRRRGWRAWGDEVDRFPI